MTATLTLFAFPLNAGGLFAAILLGGGIYVLTAVAVDVGNIRSIGYDVLRKRFNRAIPALSE